MQQSATSSRRQPPNGARPARSGTWAWLGRRSTLPSSSWQSSTRTSRVPMPRARTQVSCCWVPVQGRTCVLVLLLLLLLLLCVLSSMYISLSVSTHVLPADAARAHLGVATASARGTPGSGLFGGATAPPLVFGHAAAAAAASSSHTQHMAALVQMQAEQEHERLQLAAVQAQSRQRVAEQRALDAEQAVSELQARLGALRMQHQAQAAMQVDDIAAGSFAAKWKLRVRPCREGREARIAPHPGSVNRRGWGGLLNAPAQLTRRLLPLIGRGAAA